MPTVAVDKEDLWDRLGYRYSEYFIAECCNDSKFTTCFFCVAPEEFDRLLFEFGLELDEDVRHDCAVRLD